MSSNEKSLSRFWAGFFEWLIRLDNCKNLSDLFQQKSKLLKTKPYSKVKE
jgi:hypothetical protein